MSLRDAVADVYRQVHAPDWAAPNLDALADVLRDLSWLPAGPVYVTIPLLGAEDLDRLLPVLTELARATAASARPLRVVAP